MKTALLSLNGECDIEFLKNEIKRLSPDFVVGVDGGAKYLLRAGVKPNLVVGDMDSFNDLKGLDFIKYPQDKDEPDSELALDLVFSEGCEKAYVLCWRGERIDMEYALFMLLSKYPPLSVVLLTEKAEVFYVKGRESFKAKAGEKWSILPIGGDATLTLEGFKYEIKEKVMPYYKPYGVSNEAAKDTVMIDVKKGGVIVVRWKKKPL